MVGEKRQFTNRPSDGTQVRQGPKEAVKFHVRELIDDIRSGMSDEEITTKYGFRPDMMKRKIRAGEFAHDIRQGVSDAELMDKYNLSVRGLRRAFTKLLDAGLILPDDVSWRLPMFESPVAVEGTRELPRVHLHFPLPIYESGGIILDITEKGFRTRGIFAEEGELKSFVLPVDALFQVKRIELTAQCRWLARDDNNGDPLCGFEIIEISDSARRDLRKFLGSLSIREDTVVVDLDSEF